MYRKNQSAGARPSSLLMQRGAMAGSNDRGSAVRVGIVRFYRPSQWRRRAKRPGDPGKEAMMRASRMRSEVASDPENRKECSPMTASWRQLGVAAAGVVALVAFPSAIRAGNGLVALTTAAASCPDDSGNIYVDCGNGTVTDNRSGLTWLANANCLGAGGWHTAMEFVAGLKDISAGSAAAGHDCGLSDGSSPGEWRLPSVDEWEAMVADAVILGCDPAITNNAGTFCWAACDPRDVFCSSFTDVQSSIYWSSTTYDINPGSAWSVNLSSGAGGTVSSKTFGGVYVWPVRGGQ